MLVELVEKNKWIMGVIFVMLSGCFMNMLMDCMLDCVFDVGIVEGYVVIFFGGMVKDGLLFFCNIYFLFM